MLAPCIGPGRHRGQRYDPAISFFAGAPVGLRGGCQLRLQRGGWLRASHLPCNGVLEGSVTSGG